MGYFPNGTAGMDYGARWCDHCVHNPTDPEAEGCAVWLSHLLYNYDECNNDKSILDALIPRSESGLNNEQCKMFLEAPVYRVEPVTVEQLEAEGRDPEGEG